MNTQEQQIAKQVLAHPKFQRMARQKALLGWSFSAVIFGVYVAYIWIIGTNPQLLATKVLGITTLGIYVGMAMIIFSFLITLVYVHIANGKFEEMTQEVVKEVMGVEK